MIQPLTDEDLHAAQAGDIAALSRLLQAHQNGVYRYGLQVCRTTEDAEDALQETLWAATRALRHFRGAASSIVSWMFTIIRRECYRLIERGSERAACTDGIDNELAVGPTPDEALIANRRSKLLASALTSLHPLQREVIILRDIEGLSAPEAAAQLGISVQALKSRLHRARVNLRDNVEATCRGL
jgi:RNA polymerase sigma-70 factor (ECF subfamily)